MKSPHLTAGLILGLRPANERRLYFVTTSGCKPTIRVSQPRKYSSHNESVLYKCVVFMTKVRHSFAPHSSPSSSHHHCGLVPPYGDMELGQHWLRQWLVAWRHQAITWTNVDWSVRSHGIHLGASSLEDLKKTIKETRLKIAVLKWHPGLPGANVLMPIVLLENSVWWRTQPTYFFFWRTGPGYHGLNILASTCIGSPYITHMILTTDFWKFCTLMTCRCKEPGHQQQFHWPSCPGRYFLASAWDLGTRRVYNQCPFQLVNHYNINQPLACGDRVISV